jgi:hypothetical protein
MGAAGADPWKSLTTLLLAQGHGLNATIGYQQEPVMANRSSKSSRRGVPLMRGGSEGSPLSKLQKGLKTTYQIAQKSFNKGDSFKQIGANVMAGDYDEESVRAKLDELISSNPAVMFTWQS